MSDLVGQEVQARAVQLLRTRGDPAAADLLASCTLEVVVDEAGDVGLDVVGPLVTQAGPLDLAQPMAATLADALREALPQGMWLERLMARPLHNAQHDGQRAMSQAAAARDTGAVSLNQAVGELAPRIWAGMRFRSESELCIAQALDRAGVLFLPGALARLGPPEARHNREADFLVCCLGTWGILEVDGEPFHGPDRKAADAGRDEAFCQHGIDVLVHYDATRCRAAPDVVVAEFLAALQQQRAAT